LPIASKGASQYQPDPTEIEDLPPHRAAVPVHASTMVPVSAVRRRYVIAVSIAFSLALHGGFFAAAMVWGQGDPLPEVSDRISAVIQIQVTQEHLRETIAEKSMPIQIGERVETFRLDPNAASPSWSTHVQPAAPARDEPESAAADPAPQEPERAMVDTVPEPPASAAADPILDEPESAAVDVTPEEPENAAVDAAPEEPESTAADVAPEEPASAAADVVPQEPARVAADPVPQEAPAAVFGAVAEAVPHRIPDPEPDPVLDPAPDVTPEAPQQSAIAGNAAPSAPEAVPTPDHIKPTVALVTPPPVPSASERPQQVGAAPSADLREETYLPPLPQARTETAEESRPRRKNMRRTPENGETASLAPDGGRARGKFRPASRMALFTYRRRIRERVMRNLPVGRWGGGRVVIGLRLSSWGEVLGTYIATSSGNSGLDQAALDCVRMAGPYPRPPAGATPGQLALSMDFRFQ
jgi:TonB family protein